MFFFRCISSLLPVTYLCLPLGGNSSREAFWNPVVSKVEQRLAPWKRAFISKGGRLVLIKAVLYSLPSYFMSVFPIPVVVAKKLEKLQRDFFWNDGLQKKKVRSVDWVTICKHKKFGGLGIGRMKDKGLSLMAKWIWWFDREGSSLCKKVLCAKYGLGINPLLWNYRDVKTGSHFVKCICRFFSDDHRACDIVKKGFQVIIGNGERVRFWQDVCWDSVPLKLAFPRIFALASNKSGMVYEFGNWVDSKWVWDVQLRRPVFNWESDQWSCFKLSLESIMLRHI